MEWCNSCGTYTADCGHVTAELKFMSDSYMSALAERARRCGEAEKLLAEVDECSDQVPRDGEPRCGKCFGCRVRAFLDAPQPARDAIAKPTPEAAKPPGLPDMKVLAVDAPSEALVPAADPIASDYDAEPTTKKGAASQSTVMGPAEALAEAKLRWGPGGQIMANPSAKKPELRYWVGDKLCEHNVGYGQGWFGRGATWKDAFDGATRNGAPL